MDLLLRGDVDTDAPELTMRLESSLSGLLLLETAVPEDPVSPERYELVARVSCDVVPYVLLMPDTSTDPPVGSPALILSGVFAVGFIGLLLRRQASLEAERREVGSTRSLRSATSLTRPCLR